MTASTFPRIPHLPGSHAAPEDILLDEEEAQPWLTEEVWVFEKLDGLNVTLRRRRRGGIGIALKPEWRRVLDGAVVRALDIWVRQREAALLEVLGPGRQLYGEWMWHQVSTVYDRLPDFFLGFAVRDEKGRFERADVALGRIAKAGLTPAEPLFVGRVGSAARVKRWVKRSAYGPAKMEGVILERALSGDERWCKWVDPAYAHPETGRLTGARNQLIPTTDKRPVGLPQDRRRR